MNLISPFNPSTWKWQWTRMITQSTQEQILRWTSKPSRTARHLEQVPAQQRTFTDQQRWKRMDMVHHSRTVGARVQETYYSRPTIKSVIWPSHSRRVSGPGRSTSQQRPRWGRCVLRPWRVKNWVPRPWCVSNWNFSNWEPPPWCVKIWDPCPWSVRKQCFWRYSCDGECQLNAKGNPGYSCDRDANRDCWGNRFIGWSRWGTRK